MNVKVFGASVATARFAPQAPFGDALCALCKHAVMSDSVLGASVGSVSEEGPERTQKQRTSILSGMELFTWATTLLVEDTRRSGVDL